MAVLQTLRQPLESGEVVIARARGVVRFPARFQLVLATNPCPCGKGWGKGLDCTCRPQELRAYAAKLSGPLMDRVDLQVLVPPVRRSAFGEQPGEASAVVAARVRAARAVQRERWAGSGWATNGEVPGHRAAPAAVAAAARGDRVPRPLARHRGGSPCAATTGCCAWPGPSPTWPGGRFPAADDVGLALALRHQGRAAA